MLAAVWASPLLVDGKLYLGDEDGDVVVLAHGKQKKVLAENTLGSSVYATAVPANGALLIMNRNQLWSLAEAGSQAAAGQLAAPVAGPAISPYVGPLATPVVSPSVRPYVGW
jgi:hypothetical protein